MGHSKILIVGATGYIGKYLAEASVRLGHPTFVLVRPSTASNPDKKELLDSFQAAGITILHGDITDYDSLVAALKQVDIVISAVAAPQFLDQLKLVEAIKEVGHIKRFFPSEFGGDAERITLFKQSEHLYKPKTQVIHAVEDAGIPYTRVISNCFMRYFFPAIDIRLDPQLQKINIWGTGNVKAIFVDETDIATFTIKAADDPRTLNKKVVLRPGQNILTVNELVGRLEKKIGHELEKNYISGDSLLKKIEETTPQAGLLALLYAILVAGDTANYELGSEEVEATELYPHVKYVTVDDSIN